MPHTLLALTMTNPRFWNRFMRVLPWAVTVGVCFVVTGLLTGIKYLQYANAMAMVESFPPPYSVVSAENVATTEWTPVRRLTGTVRAPQFVQIAAEATGRVIELPAAAGHIVNTGDIVLKLFDEDLKAQRDALVADLNLVKVQLERVQKLKQQSLASQDQLDTLLARGESLRAQIASTDAQLSRLTLRAPFTGRLGIYTQSVGDLIRTGDILTTLTGVSSARWIDFKIPQGVARVSPGDTVRIMSLNDELLGEATIIAVSDALTSGLRAYDVRAEIEDASLRHGELVLVEVRTRDARITFSLPGPAVRWDIEGPHVFVLRDAEPNAHVRHRAELRRISVLGDQDGRVIALGDIKEGETIAFNGAFKLSDDSLVKIAGEDRGR